MSDLLANLIEDLIFPYSLPYPEVPDDHIVPPGTFEDEHFAEMRDMHPNQMSIPVATPQGTVMLQVNGIFWNGEPYMHVRIDPNAATSVEHAATSILSLAKALERKARQVLEGRADCNAEVSQHRLMAVPDGNGNVVLKEGPHLPIDAPNYLTPKSDSGGYL